MPGTGADYEIDGIVVYRFPVRLLPSNIFPFLFRRYNERSFLTKVKEVLTSRPVSDSQLFSSVNVCHAHTASCVIYPLAIKKLNPNCQTLLHHHDPQSFGMGLGLLANNWIYQFIQFPIVRRLHELIDCHVFISEMVKRSFLSAPDAAWTQYEDYRRQMRGSMLCHRRHARIKRTIVLHNGVDTAIFYPSTHTPLRLATTPFAIGCIANFLDWKDQATLIHAIERLCLTSSNSPIWPETIKIVFVGSGPMRSHCQELAKSVASHKLHPRPVFEFRTEVQHEQLAAFYHSLDLFVLPSYFEGFGCVFTEAFASGVPFITCEGQGMDDLVPQDERKLWLCRQRDPEDLALKMKYYIENRPVQHLSCPISFNDVIPRFVKEVGL